MPSRGTALAAAFIERTPFAHVQSLSAELRKLGHLRWVMGVLCLARILPILLAYPSYALPSSADAAHVLRWGWAVVALLLLYTAGVAVPVVLPVLFYAFKQFDRLSQANSLSATMLGLVWLLFILAAAGARVSVDARLLPSPSWAGRLIRLAYRPLGIPTLSQLRAIYLLCFVAYALMHLGAVIWHSGVDAWRDGSLLRLLLTSSYFSRAWPLFRTLDHWSPDAMMLLSRVGTIGQIIFQGLMLPLLFTRTGGRFVVAWGWVFAVLSAVLLQLSYLPLFEIVLWTALFHRPRPGAGHWEIEEPMVRHRLTARTLSVAGYALLALFTLTQMPLVSDRVAISSPLLRAVPYWFSLDVPRVFNQDDLRLGDTWPVIYRGERETLLPYHGRNGERLAWIEWNDLLLYNSSVAWRQGYQQNGGHPGWNSGLATPLERIAAFDYKRRGELPQIYTVDYFTTRGFDLRLDVGERFAPQSLGSAVIRCSGHGAETRCVLTPGP